MRGGRRWKLFQHWGISPDTEKKRTFSKSQQILHLGGNMKIDRTPSRKWISSCVTQERVTKSWSPFPHI